MDTISFDSLPEAVSQLSEKLANIEKILLSQRQEKPKEDPDELLNVAQAAEFLDLATASIYSKVSRGDLPAMKRGKRIYFSKKDLWKFLKEGRKKTSAETEAAAQQYLKHKGGNHE